MYAKIFQQIFDSSLAENYQTRHIFMDLLVLADPTGIVDMTPEAIARRTNVPIDMIRTELVNLCKANARSRTKIHEGRQLIPLDNERDWGWQIVNFATYHQFKTPDGKREYMRTYMQERRKKEREQQLTVSPLDLTLTDVTHEDADEEVKRKITSTVETPVTGVKKKRKGKDWQTQPDPLTNYPKLSEFYPELLDLFTEQNPSFKKPTGEHEYNAKKTLADLARLDRFDELEITMTLKWLFLITDPKHGLEEAKWWRGQVGAIPPLRNISQKTGLSKFASIYNKWKQYA